jgi:uncharacterized protein YndB with AHSA1/START domain
MTASKENGNELSVTRHIAAPPARVWQVMTERITEWWCPKPWTSSFDALEWRAGGRMAGMMRGPNPGEISPMEGIFLEVTPGVRFVFTGAVSIASGDWMPAQPFMIGCMGILPQGDGTRYTAWSRHWTAADCEQHKSMGFDSGWSVVAGQLAALAEAG